MIDRFAVIVFLVNVYERGSDTHTSTTTHTFSTDEVVKDVGLGTFGRVVQCFDRSARRTVAIKVVRSIRKYVESARIEADILKDVNRRGGRGVSHCVQMFDYFDFQGRWVGAWKGWN